LSRSAKPTCLETVAVNDDIDCTELRHLRYFVAVAEERHFSRAAIRVGIEQSPLSRAIRVLECDVGARLLERTTRGSSLTLAGEIFLQHARTIIAAMDQARNAVRAAVTNPIGATSS
jgi:DNA-binding transcriptional LysR family regulator